MEWISMGEGLNYFNSRYKEKIKGTINRIKPFHVADNKSLYHDLLRWEIIKSKSTTLDAGTGWAVHGDLLHIEWEQTVVYCDISIIALNYKKNTNEVRSKKLTYVNNDIQTLPFLDGSFDLVICSQVLEHVPDDNRALNEFYRVLRPNGSLVITIPNCGRDMLDLFKPLETKFDQTGHIHEYCEADMLSLLEDHNFSIKISRHHCFFIFWIMALIERSRIGDRFLTPILNSSTFSAITECILTKLLFWENRILGRFFRFGMSIEFVAQKHKE